jgi:hypothetical protein
LDEAAIVPERDIQQETAADAPSSTPLDQPPPPESPVDEQRLDVFEDFLKKLGGSSGEEKPKE